MKINLEPLKTTLRHICYWFPVLIAGKTVFDLCQKKNLDMKELIWDGVVLSVSIITAFLVWDTDKEIVHVKGELEKSLIDIENNKFQTELLKIASRAKSLEGSTEPYDVNKAIVETLTPEGIEIAIKQGLIFRHNNELLLGI